MRHNPALRALGLTARDRAVVVHADDVGMCGATVDAFFELAEMGVTSSGATMVPCPWFPEVAARGGVLRDVDLGVHLTLTSEWDRYRWGPISTRDAGCGLLDEEGYFHRNQDRWGTIEPAVLRREIDAQVDRAIAAGIDVTHVDCHMFALLHPALSAEYVDLGFARRTPVLMTRERGWVQALGEPSIAAWEQQGLPVFDHQLQMPHSGPTADWMALAKMVFETLPTGLTYLMIHPAQDTPELRAIVPGWRQRVADYETFRSDELARHVRGLGIEVLGWRRLRELMRTTIGGQP